MGKSTISMAIFNSYVSLPESTGWLKIETGGSRIFLEAEFFNIEANSMSEIAKVGS